jgi:SAM-dependent methyltransferase
MTSFRAAAAGAVAQLRRRRRRPGADVFSTVDPVSRRFGFDRGTPIDRFYIERFLASKSPLIAGRVLEIGDRTYTDRFGSKVEQSDVLHATGESDQTTLVGDLATGEGIPDGVFDCIILTQTLPFIFDVAGAVSGAHRALKPGGWALTTVPGISQISRFDMDRWGDYWRFTDASVTRLFANGFDPVEVTTHGNVATASAFLQGLAFEELERGVLEQSDPDYQVLITIAARRSS